MAANSFLHDVPGPFTKRWHLLGIDQIPIYALKGGKNWLFFEGGVSALAPVLARQFSYFGMRDDLANHWFATHSHYDHCGLFPFIGRTMRRTGITVSRQAVEQWSNPNYLAMIRRVNEWLISELHLSEVLKNFESVHLKTDRKTA